MNGLPEDALAEVRERIARDPDGLSPEGVARALRANGRPVGDAEVLSVHRQLDRDVRGAGLLEPLLTRPGVTDVLVNGPQQVWVDCGEGLERAGTRFSDDDAVRRLAQRLASSAGRRLDDASPHVDVRLSDGTRFHAILSPPARTGTTLSFRVPSRRQFDLAALVSSGALNDDGARTLQALVAGRASMLISGGTGTGKTTVLNALLGAVDPTERIVIVEDSGELNPAHPHVVCLEARTANVEGAGEITVRTLVRQGLRMRPDRLVVGEVRGAEVVDMLAAMNTGHEGSGGTIHANSAGDVPARIESLALAAGLGRDAAHSQLATAVDVVLHLARDRSGRRYLQEIGVVSQSRGRARVVSALSFDVDGATWSKPGLDDLGAILAR